MPQSSSIIATKTRNSEVHIFDYKKHPNKPPLNGTCNPDLRLSGHLESGYGLSWSKVKRGYLLSGSEDSQICVWDINANPNNKTLNPIQTFEDFQGIEGPVEDVAWRCTHNSIFGACGDYFLNIFDLRMPDAPVQHAVGHKAQINSLAFSPFNDWMVATGASDNTVKLFDARRFPKHICTFNFHKDAVNQVAWSPHNADILASCSVDRRIMVWDVCRIGLKQTKKDKEDGPAELLFIHGGHTSAISEFSWNSCEDWMVASVSDDNMLQVWQMAEHIYDE